MLLHVEALKEAQQARQGGARGQIVHERHPAAAVAGARGLLHGKLQVSGIALSHDHCGDRALRQAHLLQAHSPEIQERQDVAAVAMADAPGPSAEIIHAKLR